MTYKNFLILIFSLFLTSCGTEKTPSFFNVHTMYGDFKVTEPALIKIFSSPALERLKGIRQYGTDDYIIKDSHYSRYDHSVGVWALLRINGASLTEQIAGLLHDASHTVFSHVGDHVFEDPKRKDAYQDGIHSWYLAEQGVGEILKPYNISLRDIDPKNQTFPRLEQDLPELCADRIEYNLKAGLLTGYIAPDELESFVNDIQFDSTTQRWYFTTMSLAHRFSLIPLHNSLYVWGGAEAFVINRLSARLLKRAMECGLISHYEVHFSTDDAVWNKLCTCNDKIIQETLTTLKQYKITFIASSAQNCDHIIHTKFRGFNPWIKKGDTFVRLTECDENFRNTYNGVRDVIAQGWPVRWINTIMLGLT